MHYTITTDLIERLKTHLAGAVDEVDEADSLYQELQGLLAQPEQKPYAIEAGFSNGDSTYSVSIQKMPLPSYKHIHKDYVPKFLYTHRAAFTPITENDITDEIISDIEDIVGMHWDVVRPNKLVAAAVNAWGAKK